MRKACWTAALIAGCLLATGCSMARFGYSVLPTYALWQLDRYFALDDSQRLSAKKSIDDLLTWHQRTELPKYAVFLRTVDARIHTAGDSTTPPVGLSDLKAWRESIQSAWTPVAEQLAAPVTGFLVTLKPEQVERLQEKMADSNEETIEKYKPEGGKAAIEARGDRLVERAEFFLGSLSRPQKQKLRDSASQFPPAQEGSMMAQRLTRQRELIALIEKVRALGPQADTAQLARATGWTREYLVTLFHGQDAQRVAQLDRSQAVSDAISLQTLAGATDTQRKYLSDKLRGFADDFEQRARAAGGS